MLLLCKSYQRGNLGKSLEGGKVAAEIPSDSLGLTLFNSVVIGRND